MADQTILTGMASCRLKSTPDLQDYVIYKDILPLIGNRKNLQILELNSIKHPPDAITSMYDGFTNAFDGTSSAVHVDVVGADAKDDAAGVGAQQITIVGIDSSNALVGVAVEMGGAATVHAAAYTWKRLITAYISRVGSEGNAAAVIYIKNHAATETYITIPMGSDAAVTHRCYIPTGKTAFMFIRAIEKPVAAAGVTVVSRAQVMPWSSVTGWRTAVNPIYPDPGCAKVISADTGEVAWLPALPPIVGDNSSFFTIYTNTLNTAATGPELIVQQTIFLYDT